jgi:hypothetical protein
MQNLAQADNIQTPLTPTCLMARVGDSRHIAACCTLLEQFRFVYDDATWHSLPRMFKTLIELGAMQLCLVENRRILENPTLVAFCASIFVTDSFCSEARTKLPPYLGLQIARRFLRSKLPVLDRTQIALANSKTGVSVMACYCGTQCDLLSSEHVFAVREKMAEAFRLAHQGYQLKEIICGPIGEETLRWALDAGFRLRCDYADFYRAGNLEIPEGEKRPWLVGLTKEEAIADYGSRASGLFVFTPPRFNFNFCEQAILRCSLAGETDEEMASNLSISPWTVKKRWQSIYERVSNVDRELLPFASRELGIESRGVERRRHLLGYLRQHPEELRPLARR